MECAYPHADPDQSQNLQQENLKTYSSISLVENLAYSILKEEVGDFGFAG
jgi:hypothetical protein